MVFKKRRRHNYRRRNGHRQQHTILKIVAIGAAETKAKAKKADAAPVEAT
ncbi:bL21 family ribosomal protein, partial [Vibrio parahaemolyticus]